MIKIKKFNFHTSLVYYQEPDPGLVDRVYRYLISDIKDYEQELVKSKLARKRHRIVYRIEHDSRVYYLKKFKNNSLYFTFLDIIRTQRATRNLLVSHFLYKHDISTGKILFAMVDKRNIINHPSVMISEECEGISIKNLLLGEISEAQKKELLNMYIEIYVKMLQNRIYHRDPHFSNFMMEEGKLLLTDLDDVFIVPKFTLKLLKRNLKKLSRILLYVYIRPRNKGINFNNADREYILKEIIRRYDPELEVNRMYKYLQKKTLVEIFEVTNFIENNRDD